MTKPYKCDNCDLYMDYYDYEQALENGCPDCGNKIELQWICRMCSSYIEEEREDYLCDNCREDQHTNDWVEENKHKY